MLEWIYKHVLEFKGGGEKFILFEYWTDLKNEHEISYDSCRKVQTVFRVWTLLTNMHLLRSFKSSMYFF